jgi:hypothetical protein
MLDTNHLMLWQVDQARSLEAWCRQRRNLKYFDQASDLSGRAVLATLTSVALVLAGVVEVLFR